MKELEKKVAEAELKKVEDEILTYANKDELANQSLHGQLPIRNFVTLLY